MTPEETTATVAAALRDAPGVRALFLSGSHGTGRADAWSDLDYVLVSEDGATDEVAALWRAAVERTGEVVLWWDRTAAPTLVNAITADWSRTDVLLLTPAQMAQRPRSGHRPVFDHDGLWDAMPEAAPERPPDPARFRRGVEEFVRILGLLPLALGREEHLLGVLGVFHLRRHLIELMVEETAAPDRGGLLRLNRLLTEEQRATLAALPPPVPERRALTDAHLSYAAAYLPLARARAARIGADWPERFERATWDRLGRTLGLERPYDPEPAAPAAG